MSRCIMTADFSVPTGVRRAYIIALTLVRRSAVVPRFELAALIPEYAPTPLQEL